MLIAAAVCPHPPLLVPEVAGGAAHELDEVRAACDRAIGTLVEARPDRLFVVGAGKPTRRHPADAAGSLAGYGAPVEVGSGPAVLGLATTIGRWLARRSGAVPDGYIEVADDATPAACSALGLDLAEASPRVAVLVMGDGSARRTDRSPGRVDDRAAAYDDAVASALGAADTAALAALDPVLARDLMVAGRAAWQVLAGAAVGAGLKGELVAYQAPYGVGYLVASWTS
ncbi:hypothetical protein [Nocardiopsis ansamitocini]|uniref:hypothetical protein n=1 Tax=Nocardiopsis ansamitocini TaxID=1670832 RepID=UPI002552D918|nr:hypothetical protein [Nocardiopsis ansamitocini]